MIHTRTKTTVVYDMLIETTNDSNATANDIVALALKDGSIIVLRNEDGVNPKLSEFEAGEIKMDLASNKDIVEFTLFENTKKSIKGYARNSSGVCQRFEIIKLSLYTGEVYAKFDSTVNNVFKCANGKYLKHNNGFKGADKDGNPLWIQADGNTIDSYLNNDITYRDENIKFKHKDFLINLDGILCDLDGNSITVGDYSDIKIFMHRDEMNIAEIPSSNAFSHAHPQYNICDDVKIRFNGAESLDTRADYIEENIERTSETVPMVYIKDSRTRLGYQFATINIPDLIFYGESNGDKIIFTLDKIVEINPKRISDADERAKFDSQISICKSGINAMFSPTTDGKFAFQEHHGLGLYRV